MTSKTRTERRFIARYSIRFGRKDLNKVGFSIDLSSTGVGIASKKGYKVDSVIRIELKTPNENFLLTGQVRWVKVGTLPGVNEMGEWRVTKEHITTNGSRGHDGTVMLHFTSSGSGEFKW